MPNPAYVKIVKEFSPKEKPLHYKYYKEFYWGYGDDGELYFKFRYDPNTTISSVWLRYVHESSFAISMSMMKEIIKEFDHLKLFL